MARRWELWLYDYLLERHVQSEAEATRTTALVAQARELARAENETRALVRAENEARMAETVLRGELIKAAIFSAKEQVRPAPLPADFGEQVHRLLYAQFGRQAREAGELEELEELGEAIIALAEGYREGEPPPGSDEMPAFSKHAH